MIYQDFNIYEMKNAKGTVIFTVYDHINDENPFPDQYFDTQLEVFTAIENLISSRRK